MNLIEALRTARPLRRPINKHLGSGGNGWLDPALIIDQLSGAPHQIALLTWDDIVADDWEVRIDTSDREIREAFRSVFSGANPIAEWEVKELTTKFLNALSKLVPIAKGK